VIAKALAAATKDRQSAAEGAGGDRRGRSCSDGRASAGNSARRCCATPGPPSASYLHHHKEPATALENPLRSAARQRHSAMNAWQRRVLSWQRSVLGSEATSPCMSPSSSPSKLLRARNRAGSRTVHGAVPQVATSMSKELGPFVDGPPVEMCESYATPGPAGCAGAAREGLLSRVGIRRADCCGWNYGRGAKVTALRREDS
jgi:hypothetical protein